MRGLLVAILICAALPLQAADERVLAKAQSIADSKYHKVHVEDLKRDFHLLVRLPVGYDPDGWPYPVVYLLDGGMLFPMLGAYYQYLRYEEAVPDVIVVGVSYGASDFAGGNYRGSDFTAPSKEREHYGGAARFQRVFDEQILPLIEKSYNANPDERVILGQSLGGQFVIYSAMTKPKLFSAHIASNPALHRNLEFFTQKKHEPGNHSRLMVIYGSDDPSNFAEPRAAWLKWAKKGLLPVELEARKVDGYGHFSLAPEAFRQGLIWALEP